MLTALSSSNSMSNSVPVWSNQNVAPSRDPYETTSTRTDWASRRFCMRKNWKKEKEWKNEKEQKTKLCWWFKEHAVETLENPLQNERIIFCPAKTTAWLRFQNLFPKVSVHKQKLLLGADVLLLSVRQCFVCTSGCNVCIYFHKCHVILPCCSSAQSGGLVMAVIQNVEVEQVGDSLPCPSIDPVTHSYTSQKNVQTYLKYGNSLSTV